MVLTGMVGYICKICTPNINKFSSGQCPVQTVPKIAVKSSQTADQDSGNYSAQMSSNATADPLPPVESVVKENDQKSTAVTKAPPLCSHYKRGRCRHGISGKKLVYGSECKFLHPKKCVKYCRYGNDAYQGCQGSCGLFHPMLCWNSVWYKRCDKQECTFQHLFGTDHGGGPAPQNSFNPRRTNVRNVQGRVFNRNYMQHDYDRGWNNQRGNPVFDNKNFPPLKPSRDAKLEEMSSAISSMQHCLEKLMQHNFPDKNPVVDNSNTRGMQSSVQPTVTWNNMYPANPQFTQEAKNATNPHFLH